MDSEPSKQVLQEIKDYFDSQGISLDSRNSKTTGTLGGDKFKGNLHNSKPLFILDQERAQKLDPGALINRLSDKGKVVSFGTGNLISLRPQYRSLCWASGIPLVILEEWLYGWCGELRELAQTMGRNVILPDQECMVNGIGISYDFLAGKLRSQGVAVPDPPFRTRELLDERAARGPATAAPAEKRDVVLVIGTSNFRAMDFVSEKFKVFTLSIPGFDACKGQEGKIEAAIDEGMLKAKDYWGVEKKKIAKIYLAIFGNSAILMEKVQNKWCICENSFAKGTLRARGFKRNFGVALIAEVISSKDLGSPEVVLVPPFPRVPEVFASDLDCWTYFKEYENDILKLATEMEFQCCLFMDQLDKSGLDDFLGPDKIHWSKQGAGFIKALISKHIE